MRDYAIFRSAPGGELEHGLAEWDFATLFPAPDPARDGNARPFLVSSPTARREWARRLEGISDVQGVLDEFKDYLQMTKKVVDQIKQLLALGTSIKTETDIMATFYEMATSIVMAAP